MISCIRLNLKHIFQILISCLLSLPVLCLPKSGACLQLELSGADVSEELRRDGHEVLSRAEVQRVLDHVRVKAFLLILQLLQLKRAWKLKRNVLC